MAEFLDLEQQDSIRMPWNVLPGTKPDAAQSLIPISLIYTPLKPQSSSTPLLPYAPLRCRNCRSVINPFSIVDFSSINSKVWICTFCLNRNHFPPHYQSISDQNLPAELFPQYTTIEYETTSVEAGKSNSPNVLLFVLDVCVIEEELGFLKSALLQVLGTMPENCLVGLITFGMYVHVHELGFGQMPKVHVFKGTKELTKDQLLEQMGFFAKRPRPATGVIAGARDGLSQESIARFLVPASDCEFVLNSILEELLRDACRDAIGALAMLYLKDGGGGNDGVAGLFVKPLFEVMSENNKGAQTGAALCLTKVVESANGTMVQKICPRVCKYLHSGSFWAKASLLQVVASLSRVGAIAPQYMEPLLQSVQECLGSSDWATRKAAADALIALSSNPNVSAEAAASTVNMLESCRFDKIKPARESMNEALQLWKKISGKGDESSDYHKVPSNDGDASESAGQSNRKNIPNSSNGSSPTAPNTEGKGNNFYDKAVGILKKKVPTLTDKEPNPEFFQRLERRASVEVIVPRRCANSSNSQNEEGSESIEAHQGRSTDLNGQSNDDPFNVKNGSMQRETVCDQGEGSLNNSVGGSSSNKGNWLAIQRQLMQLERQQTYIMNMLQEFMGGSHDSMVTLENRVRGLERIVEDMVRDFSISSGRRGTGNAMVGFDGSSNRPPPNKYNGGFPEYSSGKVVKGSDGRINFGERFAALDGIASSMKSRGPFLRSDAPDSWDFNAYGKNGQMGSRRAGKSDNAADEVGTRRGWEKGSGPFRFGEGPSARSVWQASKDEATLEAIRVAGEDNGTARRVAMPELTAEALDDEGTVQERDPVWTSWSNAMDALHVGDLDTAFAEVLSSGDDVLLASLMDRSGPILDQLSQEVAGEVVNAVSYLLVEQNLFEMCLYWVQQLADIVMENGPDSISLPAEVKHEILLNLHEASSSFDLPEDWEGSPPDQLVLQLGSAWEIAIAK